jgi:hypothetical protein
VGGLGVEECLELRLEPEAAGRGNRTVSGWLFTLFRDFCALKMLYDARMFVLHSYPNDCRRECRAWVVSTWLVASCTRSTQVDLRRKTSECSFIRHRRLDDCPWTKPCLSRLDP